MIDTVSPTPTISGPAGPINWDVFGVSIDFGETMTGFVAGDITVGNGAVTNVVDHGSGRFTIAIDPDADGLVTVDVASSVATDLAGNANSAATQFSIVIDTTAPVPTITGPVGPTSPDRFDLTIDFGEPVLGFVTADLTITNGVVVNLVDEGGGRFTASIDADADGPLTVDIAAGVADDAADNPNLAVSVPFSTIVDTTGPVPTVSGPDGPLNSSRFTVLISFGESVSGLFRSEITVDNGFALDLVNGGGGNFIAEIGVDDDGPVTVSLAAGVATDVEGNLNQASAPFAVVVDRARPTPTISGPAGPTHSDPFTATIDFGEPVTGLVAEEVMVLGGVLLQLIDDGNGVFLATIKAAADGAVTVDLPANVATDLAGNMNRDADPLVVTVDTTAPQPAITGPAGHTNANPFAVTIDFGESVVGLTLGDIVIGNGAVSNLTGHGDGSYTATIDAAAEGAVTVDVPASVVSDLAGNNSAAANQFSVIIDTTAPTPTISGPASPTNQNPLAISIDFGEPVTGLTATDVTVSGGSLLNLVDAGNGRFTASVNAIGDGLVTVDLAAGVTSDLAGNGSLAASQYSVTVDTTALVPSISGPVSATNSDSFTIVVDFFETVDGFVAGDITVTGGSVSNFVDAGGGRFTATVSAVVDGDLTVEVAAGVAIDDAGNPNFAATPYVVTVDRIAPTPVIVGPSGPTNSDPLVVTVDFGESVTGFVAGDLIIGNGAVTDLTDAGEGRYSATIDVATDGSLTVDVPASVSTDAAGNVNPAANQYSVVVDTTRPVPTISGPASPTNSDLLDIVIDFGEPVTGFAIADITVASGLVTALVDNGNGKFTATVDATMNGDVTFDIAAGVTSDVAGNANFAAATLLVTVAANLDFGDAPTAAQSGFVNDYPVTLADDGARHFAGSLTLGGSIDTEVSGLPSADASGDGADEDGVVMVTSLVSADIETTSSISVTVSNSGKLDAWIDFNADGDWDDLGERVLTGVSMSAGENVLPLTIPSNAIAGSTAARFRLSSSGGLQPTGAADDGEVEDYLVAILDGFSSPQVTVEMVDEQLSLSADSGALVVGSPGTDRFRAPLQSVGSVKVVGTPGSDSLLMDLGNGFVLPRNGMQVLGGGGNNTLVIAGAGGAFDLGDPQLVARDFARVDLSAADATTLALDADSVSKLAPTVKLVEVIAADDDLIVVHEAADWRMTEPVIVGAEFWLTATHQPGDPAIIQASVPHPWQNFLRPSDVNNDGSVTALDALVIINELARNLYSNSSDRTLLDPLDVAVWPGTYFDQNGDDRASALDALRVINRLGVVSTSATASGAGEFVALSNAPTGSQSMLVPQVPPEDLSALSNRRRLTTSGGVGEWSVTTDVPNSPAGPDEILTETRQVDELLTDDDFLQSLIESI